MAGIDKYSPSEEKVGLFMRLFRGRGDLYARRFESRKTGKAGYQPACANEWRRGICGKPKVKCGACRQQQFMPVNSEAVRQHLTGVDAAGRPFVMGIYPLMLDEHCAFVAADFDQEDWRGDVAAVRACCAERGLPVAVERSRSGNGAHLWWFFARPLPARLARDFASAIVTAAMERRTQTQICLSSFDRLFPSQDTMPRGGFGNLIALPLQKAARSRGNSVFLDDDFEPHADQWAYLSGVPRLEESVVEAHVEQARRQGRVLPAAPVAEDVESEGDSRQPWMLPPSSSRAKPRPVRGAWPPMLDLVLGDCIYFRREQLNAPLRAALVRLASFQNPDFYKAQAARRSTFGTPRMISCLEQSGDFLLLPRGCLGELRALCAESGSELRIQDERCAGVPLELAFEGTLRPEQLAAARALEAHDMGVLSAGTAFGKTVVAAWLIARRGVSTLVLVNRRQLQEQWVARLAMFLGVEPKSVGRVGDGKRQPTGRLDVALMQSLCRKGAVDDIVAQYGHVIADECHIIGAPSFEQIMRHVKARYVLGLSATPYRKDGHQPIIFMRCGPIRHRVDPRQLARAQVASHVVMVRSTMFETPVMPPETAPATAFQKLCDALASNPARNALIVGDVLAAVRAGRSPVVLTERRAHLDLLEQALTDKVKHLVVLRGGMGRRQVAEVQDRLLAIPPTEERVLLATGRYLGEGFDDARLDTLFLAMPISWRGRIAQYAGRLHRRYSGKHEVRIYDYADLKVDMLARMFDRRCRGYGAIGYGIVLPLGATEGWPAEAELPVDPAWQETYAASVRRLCRDGVDTALASLFTHATLQDIGTDGEAVLARSAAEAFLYRRLETLEATQGVFKLNSHLPIAFGGNRTLEVDLLAPSLRLAVEIDGAQHLAQAEAYRRDRFKDALLQEHGYFVLRFLAEDVCRKLDAVLDAILRAMAHQREGRARMKEEGGRMKIRRLARAAPRARGACTSGSCRWRSGDRHR